MCDEAATDAGVQKLLRLAGFIPALAKGSHAKWVHPSGVRVSIADGHREFSAGVFDQVLEAIAQAKEQEKK